MRSQGDSHCGATLYGEVTGCGVKLTRYNWGVNKIKGKHTVLPHCAVCQRVYKKCRNHRVPPSKIDMLITEQGL